jgi:hypothetical protein
MPDRVKFHYLKAPAFRTIHVDGVLGGPAPSGFLNAAFFSERIPILQTSTFSLTPDGTLGAEMVEEREAKDGITREVEVNLVMSVATATELHKWLGDHLRTIATMPPRTRGGDL